MARQARWPVERNDEEPALIHPRAIIFDLDGTLLDTERLYRAAFMSTLASLGLEMTAGDYAGLIGRPSPDRGALLRRLFGPSFDLPGFLALYRTRREALLARGVPQKPGAASLLRALDRPLGVATSASRATACRRLAQSGLSHHLSALSARDDVARSKPDPDVFLHCAARLGVAPGDCLAVEDSPVGARAALAAGMGVVLIPDLVPPDPDLRSTCLVLPSLAALRRRLQPAQAFYVPVNGRAEEPSGHAGEGADVAWAAR